jgi:segregation and condensation protein A
MLSSDTTSITKNPELDQECVATRNAPGRDLIAETLILGEPITDLPQDLYIPPNALRVFLETFTGPLDLLLYLIRKEDIDILDIPIAKITLQYLEYINLMQEFHLELAAEYLAMAAILAEIKSKLLLPKPKLDNLDEEDPRAELVRRLQEYEQFKKAAENLDALPRLERDIFLTSIETPKLPVVTKIFPEVKLNNLVAAFREVLERSKLFEHHHIHPETLTVRERMSQILEQIKKEKFTTFYQLFKVTEGRMGVVITFIAILELLKQMMIEMVQNEPLGAIHVKAISIST